MITAVKMKDVASYKNEVTINTNAQVNLFYGLNGSGKTTISRFLKDSLDSDFKNCRLFFQNGAEEADIYVYNQSYIEENFYQNMDQQGIFTVGKDAVDAEKNLIAIADKTEQVEKIKDAIEKLANKNNEELTNRKNDLQEQIFERYKRKYEHTILRYCLDGKKTKEGFFKQVVGTKYISNLEYSFGSLLQEEETLQKNEGKTLQFLPILPIGNIENYLQDDVWMTIFVNTGSSPLNDLINQLGSLNWVQEGQKSFLKEGQEQCPFCQEKLPDNFIHQLESAFDQSYENAQKKLSYLVSLYNGEMEKLSEEIDSLYAIDEFNNYINKELFDEQRMILVKALSSNNKEIKNKQENLSLKVQLLSVGEIISALNNLINHANEKIKILNNKISSLTTSRSAITQKFWLLIKNEINDDISKFLKVESEINARVELYRTRYRRVKELGGVLANQRAEWLSKTTNIEESKERINLQLKSLGIEGFHIETAQDIEGHWYRLIRVGDNNSKIFKTLSEGEKTIITFIYFLESVLGMDSQDQDLDLLKRIVVIDDPISSLSNNHVYDVVRLIKKSFFEKHPTGKANKYINKLLVRQLFVFTHSSYFLHELLNQGIFIDKSRKLHRVIKHQETKVIDMNRNDILNPYQEYWLIFNEAICSAEFQVVLPNVMRNILEEFFSFIQKRDQLDEVLEGLSTDNNDFVPLYRYINRESHRDLVNLSEFSRISNSVHMEMFRKVFEEAGYLDHYKTMMNEEE